MTRVGILALQGDVAEHRRALTALGAQVTPVRRPENLDDLQGLIIPGGESTTIRKLASDYGLVSPVQQFIRSGGAVWGTCGGLILLADEVRGFDSVIGGLAVSVRRNAFGRQVHSFEADIAVEGLPGGPFRAIFIRAPVVEDASPTVEILARLDGGEIVAVKQGALLGTSFHPELTDDLRLHQMFLGLARGAAQRS